MVYYNEHRNTLVCYEISMKKWDNNLIKYQPIDRYIRQSGNTT